MKHVLVIFALIAFRPGYSQADCSKFYPLNEGVKFQITSYDEKEKLAAVVDYVVKEADGNSAILAYEMQDDKGNLVMASEYGIHCEDDGISIDFKSLAAPGLLEQYKDMEVEFTGTNIILPNNLSVGQTLPDADMLMTIKMSPITMKMNSTITNRKVERQETVTTAAGTFDCIVITNDTESKMGIKVSGSSRQWLAEGVGMVQSESYNKKGKLIGRSVLTSLSQ